MSAPTRRAYDCLAVVSQGTYDWLVPWTYDGEPVDTYDGQAVVCQGTYDGEAVGKWLLTLPTVVDLAYPRELHAPRGAHGSGLPATPTAVFCEGSGHE